MPSAQVRTTTQLYAISISFGSIGAKLQLRPPVTMLTISNKRISEKSGRVELTIITSGYKRNLNPNDYYFKLKSAYWSHDYDFFLTRICPILPSCWTAMQQAAKKSWIHRPFRGCLPFLNADMDFIDLSTSTSKVDVSVERDEHFSEHSHSSCPVQNTSEIPTPFVRPMGALESRSEQQLPPGMYIVPCRSSSTLSGSSNASYSSNS